jgi:hypothetical protein
MPRGKEYVMDKSGDGQMWLWIESGDRYAQALVCMTVLTYLYYPHKYNFTNVLCLKAQTSTSLC